MKKQHALFITLCIGIAPIWANPLSGMQTYSYPQAEWDTARYVLMYTPGDELFDGVIHPTAGLFEYYFDVDLAAREHVGYMHQLQNQGVQVITIASLLQQMPIQTLQQLASVALKYDTRELALVDTAANGEMYRNQVIKQMSRNDLIRTIFCRPTVHLRSVGNNTGVEAWYEHASLMNLYFTRDQSITTPRGHIICRMNSSQRAAETDILRACYSFMGTPPILEISGEGRLEGGDYLPAGTLCFIGCGMRTNFEAIRQIMETDAFGHDTVVVVYDHRFWQMQMHLDTHFNIIDNNLCTMVASRYTAAKGDANYVTADVFVRRPGEKKYHRSQHNIGFVSFLQQRGYDIIPIGPEDEMHYANNFLTIAPRHIMAVGGQSEQLQQAFRAHGVQVEWIPLENLIKGYGAAHCMTQVLRRGTPVNKP